MKVESWSWTETNRDNITVTYFSDVLPRAGNDSMHVEELTVYLNVIRSAVLKGCNGSQNSCVNQDCKP